MIPPSMPNTIPIATMIIEEIVKEKFSLNTLENKYNMTIYIPPIIAPLINPFFFIFILLILLPINILIAATMIIVGLIIVSEVSVYVKISDNINKNIKVVTNAIPNPFTICM